MKWLILCLVSVNIFAASDFYANKEIQDKYPGAFATQKRTIPFHKNLKLSERTDIIREILKDVLLASDIRNFETLSTDQQVSVLKKLFQLECRIMKIIPPELIIDETSIPGWAFFEFDYKVGGAGKVYLNLKKLKQTDKKSDFIILLLHETRHSAQFQRSQVYQDPVSKGFANSFRAQKSLKDGNAKMSFCDFMLLLNEFEAFQFANYIYGSLTNWNTPINDNGTLASQYDENGNLRLNLLPILIGEHDPVETFNQLEEEQFEVMH